MSFRFSILLSSLVLAAAAARAQTVPPIESREKLHLDDLVITASPLARAPDEIASPTSVLAGENLSRQRQPTLGETLSGLRGVDSTYFGPGSSRPVIRGLGGDRVRVLSGGVGTLDASVVSPDHAVSLEPLLIERVEVIRGPASLLYGGAAIGGVVNVIDGRIPEELPAGALVGRMEMRGGTGAREQAAAGLATGAAGRVAWRLDGFHRETRDVRIPGHAETAAHLADHDESEDGPAVAGRIPNTATATRGGAFALSYIGEKGHLGFARSGFDSRYGVPGHEHHHDGEGSAFEEHDEGVRIDLQQRRWDVHGEWLAPAGILRAARFQLGLADYNHAELEGDVIGTLFMNQSHEGRLELLHEKNGPLEGALGVQLARSDMEVSGEEAFVPPAVTRSEAVFLYEEWVEGSLTWQFGARAERQRISPGAGAGFAARRHSLATFTGGAIWKFHEDYVLAVSLSSNERAPNAQELFADGPHAGTGSYEVGDPALGKERSVGIDVSVRKRHGFVTGEASVFLNRFAGYIFEQATGAERDELPVLAFEQRAARFQGGEVELRFHLHETPDTVADVRIFVDSVRATNTADGTALPRVTPVRVGVGFEGSKGPWSFDAEWREVMRQGRIAPGETPTPGHTLVSAGAAWRFVLGRERGELFIRGRNLLDATARVHGSFLKEMAPLPGRDVSVGVRIDF